MFVPSVQTDSGGPTWVGGNTPGTSAGSTRLKYAAELLERMTGIEPA
jgi:hypothetical protein